MKREGEKKDERMADEKRKRYSPNDSVKCHIGAQRQERGAGCAISTRGVTGFLGGYGEKLISLFPMVT